MRKYLPGAVGFLSLLVVWEVVGRIMEANQKIATVPPFTKVISSLFEDGWSYYGPNIASTTWIALRGFVYGNAIAIGMAVLVLLVPILERPIMQLGVTSYCLPIIAVGPVLLLAYDADTMKVIITVLFVLFGTLVNLLVGLRSADPTSLDVIRAYGGGRWQGLRKVRVMASLPSFFAGLRVAGPAAVLGAILGEFFGADRGLGVGIIRSQQQLEVPRTWAIAVVGSILGTIAYLFFAGLARVATPWAPRDGA